MKVKISELSEATALTQDDEMIINNGGNTKNVKLSTIKTFITGDIDGSIEYLAGRITALEDQMAGVETALAEI